MRTLIVDDDFASRLLLQKWLQPYGETHIAVNGREAAQAFGDALETGRSYHLVCLDVMMPEQDGHMALQEMRSQEEARKILSTQGAKIIMTTSLDETKSIVKAYQGLCDGYLVKPIEKAKLIGLLRKLGLVP